MGTNGMIRFSIVLTCLILKVMASNKTVCYEKYGCFNARVFPGFGSKLPVAPESLNIKFHFFTCGSRYKSKIFNQFVSIKKLQRNARFNPKLRTIVLVHGFTGLFNEIEWTGWFKNAILSRCKCSFNFIGVDYPSKKYLQDVANAQILGALIAKLIRKLSIAFKVKIERFICVGHSLGGQICGFTGKNLKPFDKLGMILGLDPAGPGFMNVDRRSRLDYSDADLVLTIMTNRAKTLLQGFGTIEPIGHYNFYVNGGFKQPGCQKINSNLICSHGRCVELLVDDLIFPNEFRPMAYRCDSYKNFEKGLCTTCKHSLDCQQFGSWFQYWPQQKLDQISGKLSLTFIGAASRRERFILKEKFKPDTNTTFLFKTPQFLGRIRKIRVKIYSHSKVFKTRHYIEVDRITVRFMNHQKERKPFDSVLLPERSSKIRSKRSTIFVVED
ncbi:Pancreatic lipase-related protein 3 [Sarcoptes scabiei]|uniref:Pancreatic lipase-related protein 3 n=1 Tax=Sarcoptes scabiei TaxID=52283 RepID=A0A834R9J8_SARSC|nr:Pancreatic lipase-related protein 3 [Sarcoptes scabiei]